MVAHKKKIHLNERSCENFKCPECHKVFATSSSLSIHFKTHGTSVAPIQPSVLQPSMAPMAPTAPIALGGSLGPPTLSSSLGVGIGLHPASALGFSQGYFVTFFPIIINFY